MPLDPDQLRAEAEAHHARLQSPLWQRGQLTDQALAGLTAGDVMHQDNSTSELLQPVVAEARLPLPPEPLVRREVTPSLAPIPHHDPDLGLVLQSLDRAVRALLAVVEPRATEQVLPAEEIPTWLRDAAGDPRTYDAPSASRQSVCVRVQQATFTQLRQAQERFGLRTQAGAWELLLRLGLAAAERLPVR